MIRLPIIISSYVRVVCFYGDPGSKQAMTSKFKQAMVWEILAWELSYWSISSRGPLAATATATGLCQSIIIPYPSITDQDLHLH